MSLGRAILCLLLPPLAVIDKDWGAFVLVFFLMLAGWVPGAIATIIFCTRKT
ncbi:MAG: YqaE/Pmp3 family membrane protein [Verrucomicrobiia bacterium]